MKGTKTASLILSPNCRIAALQNYRIAGRNVGTELFDLTKVL